jgi:hypothetical protein
MPEENPIADAGIGGRPEVSSGPVEYAARVGALAGRFRWVICGLLFLGVIIVASAYLIALLLIHTLNPRLEPVVIGQG